MYRLRHVLLNFACPSPKHRTVQQQMDIFIKALSHARLDHQPPALLERSILPTDPSRHRGGRSGAGADVQRRAARVALGAEEPDHLLRAGSDDNIYLVDNTSATLGGGRLRGGIVPWFFLFPNQRTVVSKVHGSVRSSAKENVIHTAGHSAPAHSKPKQWRGSWP